MFNCLRVIVILRICKKLIFILIFYTRTNFCNRWWFFSIAKYRSPLSSIHIPCEGPGIQSPIRSPDNVIRVTLPKPEHTCMTLSSSKIISFGPFSPSFNISSLSSTIYFHSSRNSPLILNIWHLLLGLSKTYILSF